MKRAVLFAMAVLTLCPPSHGFAQRPDPLTLRDAVERVLETHPAVMEAREGAVAARAQVQEAQAALYPAVDANGFYSHVGPVPTLEFQDRTITLYPSDNYSAGVTIRHTVYDGGQREMVMDRAQFLEDAASENVEQVRFELMYRTIDAFNAVLFQEENLNVLDQELSALQRHLAITEGKVRSGTATDFETLTIQVRIADLENRRVETENQREVREIEIRYLLGWAQGTPLELAGGLDEAPVALQVDSLVERALQARTEMKLSRTAEAAAQVQADLASVGDKPSVSLNLTVGAKNGYVPHLNAVKANWVTGMSIGVPLFDGHRTRSRVEESEAGLGLARARTAVLERNVRTQVEQGAASVRASRAKIGAAALSVRQAEAALALAETRFEAGVATNLDVLDAQTSLSAARFSELKARYDLVRAQYQLKRSVGDLGW